MLDLTAPDQQLARFLLERGIAAIYLIAFVVALDQFPALLGERGLLPVRQHLADRTFLESPSLFHLGYSDRRLVAVAVTGATIALLLVIGILERAPLPVTMLGWFALWVLYQSIVNVGQTFYVRVGNAPAGGRLPRDLPRQRRDRPALADDPPVPLAGVPRGVRRRADQASG